MVTSTADSVGSGLLATSNHAHCHLSLSNTANRVASFTPGTQELIIGVLLLDPETDVRSVMRHCQSAACVVVSHHLIPSCRLQGAGRSLISH